MKVWGEVRISERHGEGLVPHQLFHGGNVTGVTTFASELGDKRLDLLKEAAPQTTLVAVLWNAANPAHRRHLEEIKAAAQALGLQLQAVAVRTPSDFDMAFEAMAPQDRPGPRPHHPANPPLPGD